MMKAKKEKTLHTKLKDLFESRYLELTGEYYYWQPKDAFNLKQLIKNIEYRVQKKNQICFDDDVIYAFEYILNEIINNSLLEWYKKNFTIPIINSKSNEIILTIKNQKNGITKIEQERIKRDRELAEKFRFSSL